MRLETTFGLYALSFFLVIAGPAAAQAGLGSGASRAAPQTPVVDQAGRREWVWEGRDSLTVAVPGSARYEPGGTPRIIVTGDPDAVANIEVDGGVIRQRDWFIPHEKNQNLSILVQGVAINRFDVTGSAIMDLGHLQREQLALRISGSGMINAQGRARSLSLDISGSGQANLDQLSANDANITVSGSGIAKAGDIDHVIVSINGSGSADVGTVANGAVIRVAGSGKVSLGPTQTVDANVAGSGTVTLKSLPGHSNYNISGSGNVLLVASDGRTTELARMRASGQNRSRAEPQ